MWSQLPDDVQLAIYSEWLTHEWLCLQLLLWMPPTLLDALERFSARVATQETDLLRDWVLPLVATFRDTTSPALRTLRRAHPRPTGFCCLEHTTCNHRLPLCGLWCSEATRAHRPDTDVTTLHSPLWFHFCDAAEIYPLHRSSVIMAVLPDPPCPITWFDEERELVSVRAPARCDTVILRGHLDTVRSTVSTRVRALSKFAVFPSVWLPNVHTLSWENGGNIGRELRLCLLPGLRSLRLSNIAMRIVWGLGRYLTTLTVGVHTYLTYETMTTLPALRTLTLWHYEARLVRAQAPVLETWTLHVSDWSIESIIREMAELRFPAMRVMTVCNDFYSNLERLKACFVQRMPMLQSWVVIRNTIDIRRRFD